MATVDHQRLSKLCSEYRSCTDCGLYANGPKLAAGMALNPSSTDILIVTGQQFPEEVQGGVFGFGATGFVIRKLSEMLSHDFSVYPLTGVVKCPTTRAEVMGTFGNEICAKPKPAEFKKCRNWLHQEIGIVSPHLIICMGETALAAISQTKVDFAANLGIATDVAVDGHVVSYPVAVLPTFGVLDLIRSTDMTPGSVWERTYNHFQMAALIVARLTENA